MLKIKKEINNNRIQINWSYRYDFENITNGIKFKSINNSFILDKAQINKELSEEEINQNILENIKKIGQELFENNGLDINVLDKDTIVYE